MAFVALTDLNGNAVYVEPANVVALTPIPANLLPPGVMAGSYVGDCDAGSRLTVQGSPAVVAAALAGGGGSGGAVLARGFVTGATGAVTMFAGPAFTGTRNGAGDYSLTRSGGWGVGATMQLQPVQASFVVQDGTVAEVSTVLTFDPAAAPADMSFIVTFFGAP